MHIVGMRRAVVALTAAALVVLGAVPGPASAVNTNLGNQVVSADPADFTPHVMNGSVRAITQIGSRIVVAGTFTKVSPAGTYADPSDDVVRKRIFAFDASTGAIDPNFNPGLGGAANSLGRYGQYVYVAGSFKSVGGSSAYQRIVKLTAAGAIVRSWRPVPNGAVNEVVAHSSRIYVGGSFTTIRSQKVTSTRRALAALRPSTGSVLKSVNVPFTGVYERKRHGGAVTNIKRFDVSADGSHLVAVGNFMVVGGKKRAQVVVLSTGRSASVTRWATNRFDRAHNQCLRRFDTFTRDVDFSPTGNFFVVSTTGGYGGGAARHNLCDTTSRWETNSTGNNPSWIDYTGGDTTYGVAVTGGAVYVGGHMRWQNNPFRRAHAGPGAVPRKGIAALDPVNGLPLSWNPGRSRGVGAQAMFATPQGLWVGSDTSRIAGEVHGRIALMPLAGGSQIPAVPPASLPDDLFVALAAHQAAGATATDQTPSQGALEKFSVNAAGAPTGASTTVDTSADWADRRGAFLVNKTLYYGRADGNFYSRVFDRTTGETGPEQPVNLYDSPTGQRIGWPVAKLAGAFYDSQTHRIYYSVSGNRRLFYRYFTPESAIVGAQTFVANTGTISFASVAGMTLAGGRILYGSSADGALRSLAFSRGAVSGRPSVVSNDGSWRSPAMFVPNG